MLSNQIGEEAGQVTGTRVLPDEGAGPQIEMSIQENGTLLGVPVNEMCTFVSLIRPDGPTQVIGHSPHAEVAESRPLLCKRA